MASITIFSYFNLLIKLTRNCETPRKNYIYAASSIIGKGKFAKFPKTESQKWLCFDYTKFQLIWRQKLASSPMPIYARIYMHVFVGLYMSVAAVDAVPRR